jgi:hypothetical protein
MAVLKDPYDGYLSKLTASVNDALKEMEVHHNSSTGRSSRSPSARFFGT